MDGSQIAVLVAIIVVILLAANANRGRRSAGRTDGPIAGSDSDAGVGDDA